LEEALGNTVVQYGACPFNTLSIEPPVQLLYIAPTL
jgi:hypothetical protein